MDEQEKAQLAQLNEDVNAALDEVGAADESGEDARQLAAGKLVAELARRYQAFAEDLEDTDRGPVERGLGRRVTDLRRAAAQLTRRDSGAAVPVARDAGAVPFLEQRMPRVPLGGGAPATEPARRAAVNRYSVGGEVESWCGKCKSMRTHNIVALVSDVPQQVICQACNSRHGFRDEPPKGGRAAPTDGAVRRSPPSGELEARARSDERMLLQKELAEAAEPRPFNPRGRYKAGEIIVHPEHGRGKIENVLRSSMLVRFADGLRPVDLA